MSLEVLPRPFICMSLVTEKGHWGLFLFMFLIYRSEAKIFISLVPEEIHCGQLFFVFPVYEVWQQDPVFHMYLVPGV